jgi:predicted alpha/beta hydrolase
MVMIAQKIPTSDGVEISARFYGERVAAEPTRAAVLIVPAMGTSQLYYEPFATWLASQGYTVATFDYRGIGASRPKNLSDLQADILDWARLDCAAVMESLAARAPEVPLYWIGHSLGGQILPFVPNHGRLAKAVMIASGSGYWRENAEPLRRYVWWLWFVVAPVAVAVCGYFPGKALRKVGDLPKGVMLQWRRWCLHPEYALGDGEKARAQYAAVTTRIVAFSFQDDEYLSARSTESLQSFYANAPVSIKRISPQQVGLRRIGHFGFFRADFEHALWRTYLIPELSSSSFC